MGDKLVSFVSGITLLQIVMLLLKATAFTKLSWLIVLAPVMFFVVVSVGILAVAFLIAWLVVGEELEGEI